MIVREMVRLHEDGSCQSQPKASDVTCLEYVSIIYSGYMLFHLICSYIDQFERNPSFLTYLSNHA